MQKPICKLIAAILAGVLLIVFLDRLLMPKYMSGIYEGALIAEYYTSEKDHQLLIIGDCEVYENISPITLWEQYGITSYIRGSPQQLMWQSYYLLEDALRYETPGAVLFSVYAMKYSAPQSEAYNRLTLDGMKLSMSKMRSVKASMTDGESFVSYLFPLLRFHERWKELSGDDLRYLMTRRGVAHNGFTVRSDVKPLGALPTPVLPSDYSFDEICWEYLDKARVLCENRDIDFVLFKAPVMYPHWFDEWDRQIADYADTHSLTYISAPGLIGEIGLDFSTDTYNAGLHLNVSGAEKLAGYLGGIFAGRGLGGLQHDENTNAIWSDKAEAYHALKAKQLHELDKYGEILTFTK